MNVEKIFLDSVERIEGSDQFKHQSLTEDLKYSDGIDRLNEKFIVPQNFFGQINIICDSQLALTDPWAKTFFRLLDHFKLPYSVFDSVDSEEYQARKAELTDFRSASTFQEISDFDLVLVLKSDFLVQSIKAFKGRGAGNVIVSATIPQQTIDDLQDELGFPAIVASRAVSPSNNRLVITFWRCFSFLIQSHRYCKPLFDRCSSSIFLLHGKGTFAAWQPALQEFFKSEGFDVKCGNYDFVRQFSFFNPRRAFLTKKIADVQSAFNRFSDEAGSNRKFAVVHSLGSFLFAKSLPQGRVSLDGLVLCGSIVPQEMGPSLVAAVGGKSENVINEVGNADHWPAMATGKLVPYGHVGSFGFNNSGIRDRCHEDFGHSTILDRTYAEKYWLPFFHDGCFVPGSAEKPNNGIFRQFVSLIPLDIIIAVVFLLMAAVGFVIFSSTGSLLVAMIIFGTMLGAFLWLM